MKTKQISIGNILIGGGAPVSIQSMTNCDTRKPLLVLKQISELYDAGCQIVRIAVPDFKAIEALPEIIKKSPCPIIADIHFDYKLALASIEAGVAGIRINPGNIGNKDKVAQVANAAKCANIPLRVGANSGSLPDGLYENNVKLGMTETEAMADALVQAALEQCKILEACDFYNIKVSLKSSSVPATTMAYRKFSKISNYPLHLGVTEAGTLMRGTVKSSIGIGSLLIDGIGDTIRVSLTDNPVEEVKVARYILEATGLRTSFPDIISCPSCGRTEINLFSLVDETEKLVEKLKSEGRVFTIKKIAVMGCIVNGPGEAKDAELGIAGGKNTILLFKNGEKIGSFPEKEGFEMFKKELIEHSKL